MANPGIFVSLALSATLLLCPSIGRAVNFKATELEGRSSTVLFSDLDGDGLTDVVWIDRTKFSVFFQDAKSGFTRAPQREFTNSWPAVLWTAPMGKGGESVLIMTGEGVTELCFTNRTDPPLSRQLVRQPTLIPETLEGSSPVRFFPATARAGTNTPLLLLPAADGLHVWQHQDEWREIQRLADAVEVRIHPAISSAYVRTLSFDASVSDVNGDGREDLMTARRQIGGFKIWSLYLQQPAGRFTSEPVLSYTNKADWNTVSGWIDFNHDGRVDLIRGNFLDEPFFVPGMHSGKALVTTYPADERGRIPAQPQQVFRKNDWSAGFPLVDVDGDGFVDLVLGYVPINTREGLRKIILARQIDFSLQFHFFNRGAGFSKEADCRSDLLVHLDRDVAINSAENLEFLNLINLDGDFNGDGKKDLVVRDRSKELSVYFFISRKKGFSSDPDLRFSCPEPTAWCDAKDLNGDGISDLIVQLQDGKIRIYLSQK